jgi:hypothetical protein
MSTVIDFPYRDNFDRHADRHQLWDRFERADLFEHYLDLYAQGVSQRQAAKRLQVPRTTLQAWQSWHDTLDICPHVAQFFQSGPGLAFLHRLVLALHLVCVEVGACGIRLVCLLLNLTTLDRFVAASYGAQQQVNRQVEQAIVDYRQTETRRLATDMPRKVITMTQDETFTGGLCLVAAEPVSNFIILEQLAQARDQDTWKALMAPALAQLNCEVIQSTSDEAPGIVAYVEHQLGAHHAPDLFHVQHELSKAVGAPLAAKSELPTKPSPRQRSKLSTSKRVLRAQAISLINAAQAVLQKRLRALNKPSKPSRRPAVSMSDWPSNESTSNRASRPSARPIILLAWSVGCVEAANSSPPISTLKWRRFAPSLSTNTSAREVSHGSTKPSGWSPKCRQPLSLSPVMWDSGSMRWT